MDGEHWFLIRRGDAYARIPTVEGPRFMVRHLRPARDLVVVYSPERDELRVLAKPWVVAHRRNGTPWRITMSVETFFEFLRGTLPPEGTGAQRQEINETKT